MGFAPRPRRSVLYLPGSNQRMLEKARTLPANALILDLEDAVAPDQKGVAREQVCAAVRAGFGQREVVVRINHLDSDWGDRDLVAVAAAGPDAILLPKVGAPRDVAKADLRLCHAADAGGVALWAMIETVRGVMDVAAIAAAGGRLACLVVGTNDLLQEMGGQPLPDRANLAAPLSQIVLAARCHGLAVIDGVFNDIADTDGFAAQCRQARAYGFDGKTVIHPSQIGPANDAFAPAPEEIDAARAIIAAFDRPENRSKGAILVNGKMVERLHADSARRTLSLAEAIAQR
jgi:citrate lyase subunit beta/citryl-CoA lyase